jgi:signal transduction histidine kinase
VACKNLIENAIKYSANQNRPVEVEVSDVDSIIARITIKDFGIGIPKEDLPLIFEPFYRVDRSRVRETGGYGLGLSLCKKIVTAHSGHITVESEVGVGTSFIVDLKKSPPADSR